jgi:hypothetical protein
MGSTATFGAPFYGERVWGRLATASTSRWTDSETLTKRDLILWGNGWKRMETVNDHVIKNDVCNTCSQNSTRSATYFFEGHGGQGVSRWPMHRFCFEVYGRSARNHHCTEETHRAESWVMRQTLLPHSLSLHEFQYISIHTVFIWFICIPTLCLSLVRISVPNFWYTFLLPTRRVSGPNRWRVFRIKGYRYTPDPLRTTTKSRHWVSWKQVKVATTRPEASRSESG